MPKSQYVSPDELLQSGEIAFQPIPVLQYDTPLADERVAKGDDTLLNLFQDMAVIREFESMLNAIKREGAYQGIAYNHPGPAHLSMGQEAAAVGQAACLDPQDMIFGSHRSHGEILAKGLSAIRKLSDEELLSIMKGCQNGRTLAAVEKDGPYSSVKEMAVAFLIYGALAEIFARETGFNRGVGGSMHAYFLPFGIYPNNAIVGGSADIATGAALFKRVNAKPGIVVANLGDASIGRGPVWESMNFAAMDQLTQLWPEGHKGGLPILFNINNNQYGMGGQPRGETMAYDFPARIGTGIAPSQLLAERINGLNPLAVMDAVTRKKQALLSGEGPALLDVVTYRFSGHSPSDASTYRTAEEIADWQTHDSLLIYRKDLLGAGVASDDAFEAMLENARTWVTRALKLAIDDEVSPRMNFAAQPDAIADLMYSNGHVERMEDGREPEVCLPLAENPRVKMLERRERFGLDQNGKPFSAAKTFQLRDALFEAIIHKFYTDPTTVAYGEDNRDWGGAYAVYRGLTESLPYHRFFNAPISEGAIVGSAVGYAMCGGRAIVELMYCDFLGCAGDEIFNQLAKWQAMSAGELKMPVVVRVSVGAKYGAQHSQDWSALVAHIPGLKAIFPATPYDAKGLMNAALAGTDPVICFESQRIYDMGERFHEGGVPEGYYEVPIGLPDVKREGKDVTIVTLGAALYVALQAADELQEKYGLSAEIIDARSIVPFDYEPVCESVKKTGRVVLVSDACERGSFMSEVARNLGELCFDDLDAPPVVVGARNWITPAAEYEKTFFPQPSWILDAIHTAILPLADYVPQMNYSNVAILDRARRGV